MAQAAHTTEARLPTGTRVAAVVSSYHRELCAAMALSARDALAELGLEPGNFLAFDAPGAFELPLLCQAAAARDDVHAVLAFGLVLKGETDHDRHIASAVAGGLTRVGLDADKPVLFGVLTCPTLEHARARALPAGQDKGREVALAAAGALAALDAIRSGGEG